MYSLYPNLAIPRQFNEVNFNFNSEMNSPASYECLAHVLMIEYELPMII
jgi:hypothetical protein